MDIAGNWAGRLTSVLFDATLAGVFLATWIRPTEPPAGSVAFLLLLVLIEFILIHATVFLGTVWFAGGTVKKRLTSMAFVTGLYLVFGIGFSLGFSSWFPVFAVLLLAANHSLTLVFESDPGVAARKAAERRWSRDVKLYLLMAFSTVFVPFPELGLDKAYVAGLNLPGSGAWISEPHNVMAAGAFYFGAKALLELRDAVRGTRRGITIDEPPATA